VCYYFKEKKKKNRKYKKTKNKKKSSLERMCVLKPEKTQVTKSDCEKDFEN
jgi:hypothetical protein